MSGTSLTERLHIVDVRDSVCVTILWERLDETNVRDLAEDLADLAAWHSCRRLDLDLHHVESVSSYVLMRLVVLDQKLRDAGRTLRLVNLQPGVGDIFQAAQLTDHLDIMPAGPDACHG